jgi:hypothetical protein
MRRDGYKDFDERVVALNIFFKKGNFFNRPPPPHTANYHE